MRAVVITRHGPPEVLQVQERPDPAVGPREVRIVVKAAGINFADTVARVGLYPDAPRVPCVVGYEVAGEIESVGDGVGSFKVGDRVFAGTRFNGQAELVTVREDMAYRLPEGLSFEQGAAFPVNYATAQAGLEAFDRLRPDVVILDLHLPDVGGLEVLERLRSRGGSVILLTGQGDIETAVRAMQLGAEHFLTKPVDLNHLAAATARVSEKVRLVRQNALLRAREHGLAAGRLGAHRRRGDVDAVLAEDRPDPADHPRLVLVAEHDQVVGEGHVEALTPDPDQMREVARPHGGARDLHRVVA